MDAAVEASGAGSMAVTGADRGRSLSTEREQRASSPMKQPTVAREAREVEPWRFARAPLAGDAEPAPLTGVVF
jgi:hypothetical protein